MQTLNNYPGLVACGIFCLWPMLAASLAWWLRGMVDKRGRPRLVWSGQDMGGEDE